VVVPPALLTATQVAARYGFGRAMEVQVRLSGAGARPLATQGASDVLGPPVRDFTTTVAAGQHVANRRSMSQQGIAS
jgi:hypothetical protein